MEEKLIGMEKDIVFYIDDEELKEKSTFSKMEHNESIRLKILKQILNPDMIIQGLALEDNRFMKGKKYAREYFKRSLERICDFYACRFS